MEMTKPSSESEDSQKKHVWGKFLKRYKNAPCAKDGVGLGGAQTPNRADVRSAAQAGCHEQ